MAKRRTWTHYKAEIPRERGVFRCVLQQCVCARDERPTDAVRGKKEMGDGPNGPRKGFGKVKKKEEEVESGWDTSLARDARGESGKDDPHVGENENTHRAKNRKKKGAASNASYTNAILVCRQ